eukprot:543488_1
MAFWKSVKSFGNLTFGSNKYEGKNSWDKSMGRFNDLSAVDVDGKELSFTAFDGKVLLITNVACKCGYTQGSYDKMQELAVQYADKGLRILCFPCNQFMQQEPWNEQEIKTWVTGKWPNLNPVLFSKIEVNGDNTHATYKFLKTCFPGDIHWNFATKFVVGSDGIPVARFDKKQTWDEIEKCLQNELNKVAPQAQDDEPPKNEAATAVEDEKKELKEEDEADNVEEDKAKENETENVDAKKEQQQEQQDENVDKEQEQEKEKSEAILSTKEYVFKSIDKEQNKVTCLDADFNDISFDLDANNASLLEKIEKIVGQGNDEKK